MATTTCGCRQKSLLGQTVQTLMLKVGKQNNRLKQNVSFSQYINSNMFKYLHAERKNMINYNSFFQLPDTWTLSEALNEQTCK